MIFYPGSFKPPHKGHFNNLLYLLKKYPHEKITIIISNKPRPLNIDFYNIDYKSSEEIKNICIKYNIPYTTKVNTIKVLKKYYLDKGEYIDAKMSEKIWKLYINKLLNKKDINRVKIITSYLNSPILTIMSLIKRGKYKKVYLVKSSKNSENKRFNSINGNIIIIPKTNNIDSKNMRYSMYKKKSIKKYLPNSINQKNI